MFNPKKGQSALEYLMTYGWALVVIVIVVAALVFLINPSQVGSSACTGFQSMPIGNFKLDASGLTFKVTNQTGRALSAVDVNATFSGATVASDVDGVLTPAGTSIPANAEVTVTVTQAVNAGSNTVALNLSYNDGDFTRTTTATCKGNV